MPEPATTSLDAALDAALRSRRSDHGGVPVGALLVPKRKLTSCRAALEAAVPFKLTREMVGVLGGPTAPLFTETLVDLCTSALRAARAHADSLLALIEMTGYRSDMLCFASGVETPLRQARRAASGMAGASAPPAHASAALVRAAQVRDRLMLEVPEEQLRERVEQLVSLSYNNVYTRAYDEFQRWSNGIAC